MMRERQKVPAPAATRASTPDRQLEDPSEGLGNAAMQEQLRSATGPTPDATAPGVDAAPQQPKDVIEAFYQAFARRDGAAMSALYHPDATFSDAVFGSLKGAQIGAMWTMLCASAPDLQIKHSGVADDGSAAHWDADYTFPATGMPVHNSVDARFEVRDGKIVRHEDSFDFYKWSRQALGVVGWLFGWSSFFQSKMTQASRAQLEKFQADQAAKGAAASAGRQQPPSAPAA
jgi:ketosteroid isomerase-like protein